MSRCPTIIKAQCYITLVRPTLEYSSRIWSLIKKDSINKVEAVQRGAVMFATGDYQHTSSVIAMLQQLQWQTLQRRRAYAQRVMMYNPVDISVEHHLNRTSLRNRGHSLRFLVPHTRITVYRISFFPQAIRLWNQLPGSVVEADTQDSFTAQLSRAILI